MDLLQFEQYRIGFEQYHALMEDTARISDRRERLNETMIGRNAILITLFSSSPIISILTSKPLTSWYIPIALAVVTLLSLPINIIWLRLNERYRRLISLRTTLLLEQEQKMSAVAGAAAPTTYQREMETIYLPTSPRFGLSQLEQRLIWVFLLLYPLLTILVATYAYFNLR